MTNRECTFPGCSKPERNRANQLCTGHYGQLRRGEEVRPLRSYGASHKRDAEGRKRCSRCDAWKPEGQFFKRAESNDGLNFYCVDCDRAGSLARRYNLSASRYLEMLAEQDDACAICRKAFTEETVPYVDHDHACCPEDATSCGRCVRGLLCQQCNTGVGMFGDDSGRIRAAADYVGRNRL